jgi:peptidoglycan LD-endopeptidase LytH
MSAVALVGIALLVCLGLLVGFWLFWQRLGTLKRTGRVRTWLQEASTHPDWAMHAGQRCGDTPFVFPTDGFIGFLWDDSFRPGHRHQGIDVFGDTPVDSTQVIAAYSGFLTRLPDWKSSVIIRVPDDPLQPGRQIWIYYTHMADEQGRSFISMQFPPGTQEVYVETGTLLGYQGNYSGDPNNPVGVHLHFSIVQDDGVGQFRNELKIQNTLDPSPYLGLELNAQRNLGAIPLCPANKNIGVG